MLCRFSKLIPKHWNVYVFNIARKILEENADNDEDEEDDDDIVDDFEDDENETLENIANEAAAFAPSCEEADDYDDEDCEDWDIDEFMQEDIYFMTPLDEIDAYVRFSETMNYLTASGIGPEFECRLSGEQRILLSSCLDNTKSLKHSR